MVASIRRRFCRIYQTPGSAFANSPWHVTVRLRKGPIMRSGSLALLIALLVPLAGDGQTEVHPQTSGAAGTTLFQDDFAKPANGWTVAKTDYAEFSYAD